MVESMKPGSVIMDLAAENGGNCELTQKDKVVNHNQIIIDGTSNLPEPCQFMQANFIQKMLQPF